MFKLNVANRIYAGYTLIVVLAIVALSTALIGIGSINDHLKVVSNQSVPLLEHTSQAEVSFIQSQVTLIELANTLETEKLAALESVYLALQKKHKQHISEIQNTIATEEKFKGSFKAVKIAVKPYFNTSKQIIPLQQAAVKSHLESIELANKITDFADVFLGYIYNLDDAADSDPARLATSNTIAEFESLTELINDTLKSFNPVDVRDSNTMIAFNMTTLKRHINEISEIDVLNNHPDFINVKKSYNEFTDNVQRDHGALAKHSNFLNSRKQVFEKMLSAKNEQVIASEKFDLFNQTIFKFTHTVKNQASDSVEDTKKIIIVMSLIVIALSIAISFFITRSIKQPLTQVINRIKKVSTGNLTVTFDESTGDEMGELSSNMNQLVHNLKGIISDITQGANTLSSTADSSLHKSSKSLESAELQRKQSKVVSTSISEMSDSVASVAQSTNSTLLAVEDAQVHAINGEELLKTNINLMQGLSVSIEKAATVIGQLNQETTNISTVLDVIRGVAEQTNLLALNAAIEAARAGEQGRGFAVVADEVRTLASRSHDSTAEIQELIERLLSGAGNAVSTMEQSKKETQECVEGIESMGSLLSTINSGITDIKDMSQQIASAAEEQSITAKQQIDNVTRISEFSEDSANSALENQQASHDLLKLAESQQALVSKFTV
jgi:methyl-accepting chemotaxis protein